ncbi:MAG: Ig-like domain-containing protein, partial [Lachnospiraceae bacterium]|nr:Ig-like domain-containing protein [Lachnospiraceae bacterium]
KGWETADEKVATVGKNNGKITGKKTGTVTVQNETTLYTVNVAEPAISANSKKLSLLVGQAGTLYLNLNAPSEELEDNYSLTWTSSNPKVAEVTGGIVTGLAKGSAKITAYVGGKAYTSKVTVTDTCKAPAKITGNTAEFSMNPLQSFNLKFDSKTFKVKNAIWSGEGDNVMTETTNKNGIKTGYKNSIVEITNSGKIKAIGAGITTISGNDANNRTVTLTVTVVPVSTKEATYITKGKTETIKFPKVTNKKADWWKSSNVNAATVVTSGSKMDGRVTGRACGKSDISCSYKGFTFETTACIEDPVIVFDNKEYTNNKGKVNMSVGDMKQFKIKNVYQSLNYTSNKPKVAFVDENGYVYARKTGKAVISTKVNGKTYKITITVK